MCMFCQQLLTAYQCLDLSDQGELLPSFGALTAHEHLRRTSQYVQFISHLWGVTSPWALHSLLAKPAAALCLRVTAVKASRHVLDDKHTATGAQHV